MPRRSDHPRVGGEHALSVSHVATLIGSSPRGRGTHEMGGPQREPRRIIPAWAGNTPPATGPCRSDPDHPRVGGEHQSYAKDMTSGFGSSPRGRGTRFRSGPPGYSGRIIPAWAGNTKTAGSVSPSTPDHPRVGGEHTQSTSPTCSSTGSSPRGRGTRGEHPGAAAE